MSQIERIRRIPGEYSWVPPGPKASRNHWTGIDAAGTASSCGSKHPRLVKPPAQNRKYLAERPLRKNIDEIKHATVEWVHWYNNKRLLGSIGNISAAEFEAAYDEQECGQAMAAWFVQNKFSGDPGPVHARTKERHEDRTH